MSSIKTVNDFDEMPLSRNILRGLYASGYEKPSGIQQKAIIPGIEGKDLLIQSQSGSGKTVTFSTMALQLVESFRGKPEFDETLVLILCPNRELAHQTYAVIEAISKYVTDLKICKAIGGYKNIREESDLLLNRPQIVIGTMGRVMQQTVDLKNLITDQIRLVIIDEADEMLKEQQHKDTFREQIGFLYNKYINPLCQSVFVSATYTTDVIETSDKILRKDNTLKILSEIEDVTLNGIKQYYVECLNDEQKECVLDDLYKTISVTQSVIFVNTRRKADYLSEHMRKNKWIVSVIHKDLTQSERDQVVRDFRNGLSRILIATDIFCRGIDIQTVSVVMNYELSNNIENYVHRIGRSGRHGRKGTAINLVSSGEEMKILKRIETNYKRKIDELPSNFGTLI